MYEDLKEVSWANINSILDITPKSSFKKNSKDSKFGIFSKLGRAAKNKKKKQIKEIERIKQKVEELMGEASLSRSLIRSRTQPWKRKKLNLKKVMKDCQSKFPAGYFESNFDLRIFLEAFKFTPNDYHQMMIFLMKYVDKAEISINFLIWEKKDDLMSLIAKIFTVSKTLTMARQTHKEIMLRFHKFVHEQADEFIRRRNGQMKRVRLLIYREKLEWLKNIQTKIKKINENLAEKKVDKLFEQYSQLQELLEDNKKEIPPPISKQSDKIVPKNIDYQGKHKEEVLQQQFVRKYSHRCEAMEFKKQFMTKFYTIKDQLARIHLDHFRFHFKEFLVEDIGKLVALEERPNFYKFLAGSEFSPTYNQQYKIRDLWNSKDVATVMDLQFIKSMQEKMTEIYDLTKDLSPYISQVHQYPELENLSLYSQEKIPSTYLLNDSTSLSQLEKKNLDISYLQRDISEISLKDHGLLISKLFVFLNQLMSFDTGLFSNEIFDLYNRLSSQIRQELLMTFRRTNLETVKEIVSPKDFKLKLVQDYFNIQWEYIMKLLFLIKLNLYGIIACSKNKGVCINESYIMKVLKDHYFLLNNITQRMILGLKNFIKELFQDRISFHELLGLKNIFVNIYTQTSTHMFNNLSISEKTFDLNVSEIEQLRFAQSKVSYQKFLNFLWQIELSVIKSYAVLSLKNMSLDVENENWKDLNVSFDIIDQLNFLLNENLFYKNSSKQEKNIKNLEIKSDNTLLVIDKKYFR